MRKFSLSLLSLALLMAGCATVGPNYSGPPQGSVPQPAAFARAGDAALPSAPVAQWWTSLGDPALNDLMTQALSASPSLDVARARLRQARSGLKLEQANEKPSLSATGMYAHARLPGFNLTGQPGGEIDSLDLYNVGFDASWEIDLYGAHRRAIESAGAAEQGAQASLADAQVSLTAEVANAYVNLRDRQWRIDLTRNSVTKLEQMLELTRQRYAGGTASKLDVARLESQLESTRASIAPLDADRQAYLDELAALLGQAPGELDATLHQAALPPLPPAQVAVGDPATLLQRRPDIRAAERQLAADTAKIGQAEAAKFPSVKFMGILGLGGTHPEDLTKLDDFVGLISPQINWSFLDFGRNAARVDQAQGKRDESLARYRQTVVDALRDAEDSLARFRSGREQVATLARAKATADIAADLSAQRYRAGTASLLDVLDAERQQIGAEQQLAQARSGLTNDFVAVQKALGLGWGDE